MLGLIWLCLFGQQKHEVFTVSLILIQRVPMQILKRLPVRMIMGGLSVLFL